MNCELVVNVFQCLDQVTWVGLLVGLFCFSMLGGVVFIFYMNYKIGNYL